ncbi:sirohydrochlorin chelatase [Actinomadura scrupuli]|uniref:sirohydrochlorin chelatase n=1 Tax=Actinomadura scrupuli TaxID=559629 RepID=UPI003D975FD6
MSEAPGAAGPPLLLVGHGTRDEDGAADFGRFVERLDRRLPVDVAGGFIELSPPPLTEAVAGLYRRGHRRLAAVPMMLVAAGHGKGDIPAAMARELVRHPGMSYVYGRPLGPHPVLLRVLEERLDAVLGGADRAGTTVLLVGRGSTDPDANAEICKVARLLWEGRGLRLVEPAFVSLAEPGVAAGLERCRLLLGEGGPHRIVVLPYFLFAGVLPDRVVVQTRQYAAEHPGLDIRVAEVIGDCDGLAELVAERYAEALAGDIRMNCDTCVYRSALPGFEDRVGAAQQPHHHPDDPAHGHGHAHAR